MNSNVSFQGEIGCTSDLDPVMSSSRLHSRTRKGPLDNLWGTLVALTVDMGALVSDS